MVVLAAVPSVSVLAVSARSASFGFVQGAFTALGIVVGDLLFIMLAIFGLALLVEAMGNFFFLVKYLGGAYLIWMGIAMWQARPTEVAHTQASSIRSSFMSGLLITLGDQKAVLFYLGFLPAFLDLHAMSYLDIGIASAVTILAVGGVKLAIAYAADRAGTFFGVKAGAKMTIAAACVMISVGVFVIIRA
ncbi:MAG: LysE family translocator [Candidatus Competibacteraceae bacterium]|nr:LysE family translocator [Candidatus Competibacteraceae bacterium]